MFFILFISHNDLRSADLKRMYKLFQRLPNSPTLDPVHSVTVVGPSLKLMVRVLAVVGYSPSRRSFGIILSM